MRQYDIKLHGIIDQHGAKRPWVWSPYGWNHFFLKAIDIINSKYKIECENDFYQYMKNDPPRLIIEQECTVHVHDPSADPQAFDYQLFLQAQAERMKRRDEFRTIIPDLVKTYPDRTVMLIGDYNEWTEDLASYFELLGWEVVDIATDLWSKPLVDRCLLGEIGDAQRDTFRKGLQMISITPLIRQYEPDYVIISQNYLELDFTGNFNTPVFYYAHKGAHPMLPHHCKLDGFFHAYLGAPDQYKISHHYFMNKMRFQQLIPYAWNSRKGPKKAYQTNRPINFGFMGTVGSNPEEDSLERRDFASTHIRHLRNDIIPYAQAYCDLDVRKKGPLEDYWTFLSQTYIALNVSANYGWINQRQYEVMGRGCILMQNYYKNLAALGFVHKKNCLIYKDKTEIAELLKWVKTHPTEAEQIRLAGIGLAYANTYKHRVETIMETILAHDGEYKNEYRQ